MPTIDELAPAPACADSDMLMVSQAGIARKASRAQLLAGVQPQLSLSSGNLLGRVSGGIGAPEAIAIGANLTLAQGALSAPAPFSVAALPAAGPISEADLVVLGQSGGQASTTYAAFLRGMAGVPGIDASALTVAGQRAGTVRTLSEALEVALPIEAFGAAGDGETDDTSAFVAALASGLPVRLDARTYVVDGPLTVASPAILVGTAPASTLRRGAQTQPGAWLTFAASVNAFGVTFDAGAPIAVDAASVSVAPTAALSTFRQCIFINASGPAGGCGMLAAASCTLIDCLAASNAADGLRLTGAGTFDIRSCSMTGNIGAGISWQGTGSCRVAGCSAAMNGGAGIALSGPSGQVRANIVDAPAQAPAIVVQLASGLITDNVVTGGARGIDARGSSMVAITGNDVAGSGVGVDVGGTQNLRVAGNRAATCAVGILARNLEPETGMASLQALTIAGNWVGFTDAGAVGIALRDGPLGAAVRDNILAGWGSALRVNALQLDTDAAIVRGNTWNNTARWQVAAVPLNGGQGLVVPEMADEALVLSAASGVQSVQGEYQLSMQGRVTFIRVTEAGSGYSRATVTVTGSGAGAQASAVLQGGAVIGVLMTAGGSGYAGEGSVSVAIFGDGQGAAAVATVGLPVLEGRILRLACNAPVLFSRSGASPAQENWTLFDTTVPANARVTLEGSFGEWRLLDVPPADYISPSGDGGAVFKTVAAGDLTLRPAATGSLRIASDQEPRGFVSSVGRGSPNGVVAAPPGSDFRNLNGGPGQTLWVKQSGIDTAGWVAIA